MGGNGRGGRNGVFASGMASWASRRDGRLIQHIDDEIGLGNLDLEAEGGGGGALRGVVLYVAMGAFGAVVGAGDGVTASRLRRWERWWVGRLIDGSRHA